MNETKFPQFGHTWKNEHVYGEIEAFDIGAVEDWFRRCMEDFPTEKQILEERPDDWEWPGHLVGRRNRWFKKWFSQFKENHDD